MNDKYIHKEELHDKEIERLNNSEVRQALKNVLYNGF